MNYTEARKHVTSGFYVALKCEGEALHPDHAGVGSSYGKYGKEGEEFFERQLNAYIKRFYGVTPDQEIDMKWILIIITFYQPHVKAVITEIEFNSPSECMDQMALYEMAWKNADKDFHYRMSCTAREEDD